MSSKRKCYSIAYKKTIVEEIKTSSLVAVSKTYGLDERMLRRWKNSIKLDSDDALKYRIKGAGRKSTNETLEDTIFDWIADRRSQCLIVRRKDIQKFALNISSAFISGTGFKASNTWLNGFMNRYELSLRRPTTLFKLEDDEIVRRALSYKLFVDKININQYNRHYAIAMDETAIYFGDSSQTTVTFKGSNSVYIPSTGYESCRVTCILAFRLDGEKIPPMIIIKGSKNEIIEKRGFI